MLGKLKVRPKGPSDLQAGDYAYTEAFPAH